jgi:hypothetical protein
MLETPKRTHYLTLGFGRVSRITDGKGRKSFPNNDSLEPNKAKASGLDNLYFCAVIVSL